jgi:Flp pilus assembly protein TadG
MLLRIRNRLRCGFKRYRSNEKGATAIEFAFVGAPFLYLLMVIFETGLMLFAEYAIQNGTANAARMIRTGEVQASSMSAEDFKEEICTNLEAFLNCKATINVDVQSFADFASVSTSTAIDADGNLTPDVTTGAQFEPGNALDVSIVRVYYPWQLYVPLLSQLSNMSGQRRLLTAGAAFRNEPF